MNPGRQIVYLLLGDGDGSVRALLDDKFARIVDRTDGVLFAALIDIGQMFEKGRLVNYLKPPLMIRYCHRRALGSTCTTLRSVMEKTYYQRIRHS